MAESRSTRPPVGGVGEERQTSKQEKNKKTKQQKLVVFFHSARERGFRGEAAFLWLVGGPHTFSVTMVTALPRADFELHPRGRRLIEWLSGCETRGDVREPRTLTDTLHTEAGSPGRQKGFCCMRHAHTFMRNSSLRYAVGSWVVWKDLFLSGLREI